MPEIFSINGGASILAGDSGIAIQGVDFGFTTNIVIVSPTDDVTDGAAFTIASFTSWTDDYIVIDAPDIPQAIYFWFVVNQDGFPGLQGYELEVFQGFIPDSFENPSLGLLYEGRDGEIHFLDKTQASAAVRGTPWGMRVAFEEMDFSIDFTLRPPDDERLDRERLTRDSHLAVGDEENLLDPTDVSFSFVMSSHATDALPQFIGLDWIQGQPSTWQVKGTPIAGLVSTKGRGLVDDGLYVGGRIDGAGRRISLSQFADARIVAVDLEVLWMERDASGRFGYRLKEVCFDFDGQNIVESEDLTIVELHGRVYGEIQRITRFSRSLDILSSRRLPEVGWYY